MVCSLQKNKGEPSMDEGLGLGPLCRCSFNYACLSYLEKRNPELHNNASKNLNVKNLCTAPVRLLTYTAVLPPGAHRTIMSTMTDTSIEGTLTNFDPIPVGPANSSWFKWTFGKSITVTGGPTAK